MRHITPSLSKLSNAIFRDFVERGGVLRDGTKEIHPDLLSSQSGGLPALLWMTKEFVDDYELGFPILEFLPDGQAYTGFALVEPRDVGSSASLLLKVSDFLRNEVVPVGVVDLDLGALFSNFKEWCEWNVSAPAILMKTTGPHPE
jgi:hypothetical protein